MVAERRRRAGGWLASGCSLKEDFRAGMGMREPPDRTLRCEALRLSPSLSVGLRRHVSLDSVVKMKFVARL